MENLTLSSNHSECYPVDSASRRRSFMFFYLAIIVTAIPSNAFSLYVSWQHIRQKNGLGVYLFNLALSDLTFTIGLSLWLDFLWKGHWIHGGYVWNLVRANVARFILGFIIPFLLVVFSTWGIWEAVKSNQATKERERKRILKLLTVVLLCVLFCFGPIHVMMLLRTQMDDCREVAWLLYPYKISIALSSLNCLADPLLYCFITRTGKANVNQVVLFFQVNKRSNDEDVV
ncbi:hypothetical protein JOQ06_028992 [Pogonophryne albipinna]|uniref:G-protein coupled receptors family 1 profile domain-containing protein n=1 Tax=Pogonophryne albipinna TaxID=1090488 RepID=A0AAD6B939_9TELE|nr:hypothetical protein JOQ06_028992 [Pogonophryne albipinna]